LNRIKDFLIPVAYLSFEHFHQFFFHWLFFFLILFGGYIFSIPLMTTQPA